MNHQLHIWQLVYEIDKSLTILGFVSADCFHGDCEKVLYLQDDLGKSYNCQEK